MQGSGRLPGRFHRPMRARTCSWACSCRRTSFRSIHPAGSTGTLSCCLRAAHEQAGACLMERKPTPDPGASESGKVKSEGEYIPAGKRPEGTHPIPENEGLVAKKDREPPSRV